MLTVTQLTGFNTSNSKPTEVQKWEAAVLANGGTFGANSITWATALSNALAAASYSAKVVYLLPLLGSNLAAALVPLRNSLGAAPAGNTNFVNGDFSEATGLQGDGSSKQIDTHLSPGGLGAGNNAGYGYWENNINFGGTGDEAIGCYNTAATNRYVIGLRNTNRYFAFGSPGNSPSAAGTAINAHYYAQRASAASREIFENGSSIATNTTSDGTSGSTDDTIRVLGSREGTFGLFYWKGRCAASYLTDGTLSGADVAAFHTLLSTYLITPTGR